MLSLPQLHSLSPNACKLFLLFQALSQGRLIVAPVQDLARQCGFSLRTCRIALSELLATRLILRQPARYHSPCTYLFGPVSSCPSHLSRTDRQPVAALPRQDRQPAAALLTPVTGIPFPVTPSLRPVSIPTETRATPCRYTSVLSPTPSPPTAPRSPQPASQDRQPAAALLTQAAHLAALQSSLNAPPVDPLTDFVNGMRHLPPDEQEDILQHAPPETRNRLRTLIRSRQTPLSRPQPPNTDFPVP